MKGHQKVTLPTLKTLLLRLLYCSSRRIKGCHIKKCSICHFSAGYPSLMVTRLKKFLNLVLESSSSQLTYPIPYLEKLQKKSLVLFVCFFSALLLKDNYDFLLNLLSTNVLFPSSSSFFFIFIAQKLILYLRNSSQENSKAFFQYIHTFLLILLSKDNYGLISCSAQFPFVNKCPISSKQRKNRNKGSSFSIHCFVN